ncbi:hypothetical protein L596_028074 [Steinernema carpocapsae]|uniref:Uncharacterized protein n=1 Tax=Steinernema carpocapsae TaxID=34508 RepID=A0A4U5LXG1_STECR|nr:hypothetical protein L596_028074 [Steinernema carpocapsae]
MDIRLRKHQFDFVLIVFSITVFLIALVLAILIWCKTKVCLNFRSGPRYVYHEEPARLVKADGRHLSVQIPDLDYIDSRNTELISSTVKVDSLHNSPVSHPAPK